MWLVGSNSIRESIPSAELHRGVLRYELAAGGGQYPRINQPLPRVRTRHLDTTSCEPTMCRSHPKRRVTDCREDTSVYSSVIKHAVYLEKTNWWFFFFLYYPVTATHIPSVILQSFGSLPTHKGALHRPGTTLEFPIETCTASKVHKIKKRLTGLVVGLPRYVASSQMTIHKDCLIDRSYLLNLRTELNNMFFEPAITIIHALKWFFFFFFCVVLRLLFSRSGTANPPSPSSSWQSHDTDKSCRWRIPSPP